MTSYSSSDAFSKPDFFFRVADRLRMESCAHSLVNEGKSLMLYCPSSALLSHYGGQLIARLRSLAPRTSVEVFFPSNSEALVTRFNEVLANLSIDKATQSPEGGTPEKIWVVHDANALTENELQLLTRLLQHFPGAKVCAVLMLSGKTHPMNNMDTQNRRIVRWDMELPSLEQAEQTLQQASSEDGRQAVQLLIEKMQLNSPPALTDIKVDLDPDVRHWEEDDDDTSGSTRKSNFGKWVLALVLMLGLSVGVTAWLQPKAFADLANQAVDWVFPPRKAPPARAEKPEPAPATPAPATTPAAEPAPSASPAADAASAAASSPAAPAATTTGTSAATPAATSATNTPANTATPPAATPPAANSAAGTTAATTAPAAVAKPEVAVKEAEIVTELPDIAVKGQKWLSELPKDSFVVLHGTFTTAGAAQKLIRDQAWLNQARVIPFFKSPKDPAEFIVVTGPFRAEERAKAYITRLDLPASTRTESVIKLLPSTRNGDEKPQKTNKVRKP